MALFFDPNRASYFDGRRGNYSRHSGHMAFANFQTPRDVRFGSQAEVCGATNNSATGHSGHPSALCGSARRV
jgi:hypothetical protein